MCTVRQMPDKLEITKVNIREVCFCLYTSVLQIYPVSVKAIFQHSTLLVTNTSAISLSNGNTFKYFCFLPYPPDLYFLWVWELFKGPESTSGEEKRLEHTLEREKLRAPQLYSAYLSVCLAHRRYRFTFIVSWHCHISFIVCQRDHRPTASSCSFNTLNTFLKLLYT